MIPWRALLIGLALASLIGLAGYWRRALSDSGVLGAIIVGTLLFAFGGFAAGVLLVAFFVSSSALSYLRAETKAALAEQFSKGSRRDLGQALANGGVAAALALAYHYFPHDWLWAGLVGALATANADTWATELGVLAKSPPRLITTGQPVAIGTSGGITAEGTLAALGGALLISLTAGVLWLAGGRSLEQGVVLAMIGALAGLLGSLLDSGLGATIQAIYYCDVCQKETERHPLHHCSHQTRQIRGLYWLDNDWVNLIASSAGALLAASGFLLV